MLSGYLSISLLYVSIASGYLFSLIKISPNISKTSILSSSYIINFLNGEIAFLYNCSLYNNNPYYNKIDLINKK